MIAVLACLLELLLFLVLLFALEDFSLALDNRTPLIGVPLAIAGVVPIALLRLMLDRARLVTKGLFYALRVHLERVNYT